MDGYKYRAIDSKGKIKKGIMYSDNINDMIGEVYKKKLLLIDYKLIKVVGFNKVFNKVKDKDIAIMSKELSIILKSGIDISKGISIITNENINNYLKLTLKKVKNSIDKGKSIYDSVSEFDDVFPKFMRQMIKVGEESGDLDKVFLDISVYYMEKHNIKHNIIDKLIYPISTLLISILVSIFIITNIIPGFIDTIIQINEEVPKEMMNILKLRDIIISIHFKIFIIAFFLLIFILYKIGCLRKLINLIKFKCPFIGKIYKDLIDLNIGKGLYILIKSGIPVISAFEIIKDMYREDVISNKINKVIYKIEKGYEISRAVGEENLFNKSVINMLSIGEETGSLDEMLKSSIILSEEEIKYKLNKAIKGIRPVTMCIVGFVVIYIMINILIPVMNSVDSMGEI